MSNELYHHGILGQKWGVRRFQKANGSLTAAGKAKKKEEPKELSEYEKARFKYDNNGKRVKKTLENMTNDELREASERYNLEKNYKESKNNFNEKNSKVASTGAKVIGSMIASSSLVLLTNKLGNQENAVSGKELVNKVLLTSGTVGITVLAGSMDLKTS